MPTNGKIPKPQNVCCSLRYGDQELGEDSPCIYIPISIHNSKENLMQVFCNIFFEVDFQLKYLFVKKIECRIPIIIIIPNLGVENWSKKCFHPCLGLH
jgi:hypothetical protein